MRVYFWPTIALLVAAGLQANFPVTLTVFGVKPDLILVVLIACSLAADPIFGAGLGFIAGLIHGSSVGLSLGGFIVTRTITGFLAGFATTRLFSENPIVPMLSAIWLTAVCEGLFLLTNPRFPFFIAARIVFIECLYNAFLTLILYWLLRSLESRRKIKLVNARI